MELMAIVKQIHSLDTRDANLPYLADQDPLILRIPPGGLGRYGLLIVGD